MNFRNKKIKALSIFMSLLMLVSVIAPAVSATEHTHESVDITKEPIKYVSLGDSMTNGYGLDGYKLNSGVETYGEKSYANQFADWLAQDTKTKVDHAQLAMSGMRVEDLHWLLELDYDNPEVIDVIETLISRNDEWKNGSKECEKLWNSTFTSGDFWTLDECINHGRIDATYKAIVGEGGFEAKVSEEYKNELGEKLGVNYNNKPSRAAKIALIAKYYQEHVAAADIISLGIGNGNLGVFGFGRILDAIEFDDGKIVAEGVYNVESAIHELDPATQELILDLKAELMANVAGVMPEGYGDNGTLSKLADAAVYIGLSMVLNYMGTYDAIIAMNPDVELIQVGIMNTFAEEGEAEGVSIGTLMDVVVTPMNAFLAAYPTYKQLADEDYADAKFYYAEADRVECMVEVYGQDFYLEDGTPNPDSIIRDRFVESIVGYNDDGEWVTGTVWGLLKDVSFAGNKLVPVTFQEIMDYEKMNDAEKAEFAVTNAVKVISISVYLAVEKAIIESRDSSVSLDAILGLGNLGPSLFAPVFEKFEEVAADGASEKANSVIAGIAAAVKTQLENNQFANNVNSDIIGGIYMGVVNADDVATLIVAANGATVQAMAYDGLVKTIWKTITEQDYPENAEDSDYYETVMSTVAQIWQYDVDMDEDGKGEKTFAIETAETTAKGIISGALTAAANNVETICGLLVLPTNLKVALKSDETVAGLLGLMGRCMIGNGLGAHPSEKGHDALFEAVKKAYAEDHTAQDETVKNILILLDLVKEYYDDAYAYAYAQAVEDGTIAGIIASIEEVKGHIADAEAWIANNSEYIRSEEFVAQLAILVDEAYQTVDAIVALINEADYLDADTNAKVVALLNQLGEDVEALASLLGIAVIDGGHYLDPKIEAMNAQAEKQIGIVIDQANKQIEILNAQAEKQLAILNEQLMNAVGEAEAAIRAEIERVEKALEDAIEEINTHVENEIAAIQQNLKDAIEALETNYYNAVEELKGIIDDLNSDVAGHIVSAAIAVADIAIKANDYFKANYPEEYAKLVDMIQEAVVKFAPELDMYLYNWFYENPDKVIAFFEAYGDDMIEFLVENKEIILPIIAYVAYYFGSEAVEFVMNNPETALKAMVNWYEKYGDRVWDLIDVYLETLGVELDVLTPDQIIAAITNIFNLISEFGGQFAEIAWDKLVEYGVIDEILNTLDEIKMEAWEQLVYLENVVRAHVLEQIDNLKAEADRLNGELQNAIEDLKNQAHSQIEIVVNQANKQIEILNGQIIALRDQAHAQIAILEKQLETAVGEAKDAIEAEIARINAELKAAVEAIEAEIARSNAELKATVDAIDATLNAQIQALKNQYAVVIDAINSAIAKIEATLDEIDALILEIKVVVNEIIATIEKIDATISEIIAAIESGMAKDQLFAILKDAFLELGDALIDLIDTAALLEQLDTALKILVTEGFDALVEHLKAVGNEVANDAAEALKNVIDSAIVELTPIVKPQIEILVAKINAAINLYINDALNGEYTVSVDSDYVAIGDNAYYADILANALGLSAEQLDKMGWNDIDFVEIMGADLITVGYDESNISAFAINQLLGYAAEYINGDLRGTVNEYANNAFATFLTNLDLLEDEAIPAYVAMLTAYANGAVDELLANELLAGKTTTAMDWVALVGEDNVSYIEKARAELRAELLGAGVPETVKVEINVVDMLYKNIDTMGDDFAFLKTFSKDKLAAKFGEYATFTVEIPVVDTLIFSAESYLYSYVNFNHKYFETILAIQAINPTAQIVVLGGYNAFDGVTFDLGATSVNLGDLYGYLVDATSTHSFVYSLAYANVTYVDISETETAYEAAVAAGQIDADLETFLMAYLSNPVILGASAQGNYYIAAQILNALTITCEHAYDNDCDADCNFCGETREVADHIYDNACDTDCNVCGGERVPAEHVYDDACDADCNVCGETRGVGEHVYDNACDATCNECGATREVADHVYDNDCDATCNECNAEREVGEHVYDNDCDATCNICNAEREVGEHVYYNDCDATCNICNAEREVGEHVYDNDCDATCNVCENIRVPADHDYNDATCTAPATCKVCGATAGSALGHNYSDATCEAPATCTRCDATTGEALGHSWVDATCEAPKTCTVCNKTEGEALGHSWTDATCTAPTTCTTCNATAGSALGHNYSEATCEVPATCTRCDATTGEALGHSWVDATCEAPKTCTVCNKTEGEALGHNWTDATCVAAKTCTVCNKTEGEALGHKYDNACDAACNACDATRTPAAHVYGEWSVVKDATATEDGERQHTCTECGNVESEVIPALGETEEKTPVGVVIAIVVASTAGTAGIVFAGYWLVIKKKFITFGKK